MMKTLPEIQAEIGKWAKEQFKENASQDIEAVHCGSRLGSLPALLGMVEELGELCRVVARKIQGRWSNEKNGDPMAAKADALADCMVFMCDYATREDIDLMEVLNLVWEKVCRRRQASWVTDKEKEEAERAAIKAEREVLPSTTMKITSEGIRPLTEEDKKVLAEQGRLQDEPVFTLKSVSVASNPSQLYVEKVAGMSELIGIRFCKDGEKSWPGERLFAMTQEVAQALAQMLLTPGKYPWDNKEKAPLPMERDCKEKYHDGVEGVQ
jgi:NTP pyrophosphatase (non-canonical NTP hydrolase)